MHRDRRQCLGVQSNSQQFGDVALGPARNACAFRSTEQRVNDGALQGAAIAIEHEARGRGQCQQRARQAPRTTPQKAPQERAEGVTPRDRAVEIEYRQAAAVQDSRSTERLQAARLGPASWRSTNGSMPPWRKYSRSFGVSMRTRTSKRIGLPLVGVATTMALRASLPLKP